MSASFVIPTTAVHHQNSFSRYQYVSENHHAHQHPQLQQMSVPSSPSAAGPQQQQRQHQQGPSSSLGRMTHVPLNGIHIPLVPVAQQQHSSSSPPSNDETASLLNATTNAAATTDQRHILAERFKTKVCRNYLAEGFCPYEQRCMFAHGDEEVRTAAMNIRDGLFTEEAIKSFKRAQRLAAREAKKAAMPRPPSYDDAVVQGGSVSSLPTAVAPQQQQQQQQVAFQYLAEDMLDNNDVETAPHHHSHCQHNNNCGACGCDSDVEYVSNHEASCGNSFCSGHSGCCLEAEGGAAADVSSPNLYYVNGNSGSFDAASDDEKQQHQQHFVQQPPVGVYRHNPYSISKIYVAVA